MNRVFMYSSLCFLVISLAGCATSEQLAKNLANKSISANGNIVKSKIGVDENKIPTISIDFIDGNFKTIKTDNNYFDMSVKSSAATFNSSAKTITVSATLQTK